MGDVDGLGLALRAEICAEDGFTPDKAIVDRMVDEALKGDLVHEGRRYGLVLDIGGYYKHVITLAPAPTISYAEINLALVLLYPLIPRVTRNTRAPEITASPSARVGPGCLLATRVARTR